MLTRCAWCDRIAVGTGWVPHEDFQTQQTPSQPGYRITHGICPDCFAVVRADRADRATL